MRIGLITDVHLTPEGHPPLGWHNPYSLADAAERFERALAHCVAARVEAIAVLGDLSHLGDDETLKAGVRIAAASGYPVWFVSGNHDLGRSVRTYAEAFDQPGASNTAILGLDGIQAADNVTIVGIPLAYGSADDGRVAGAVIGDADPTDGLLLVLSHYPIVSLVDPVRAAGLKYAGDLANRHDAEVMLRQRPGPTVVVHGHLHIGCAQVSGSILQIGCAALIEPPFECTILDLTGEGDGFRVQSQSAPMAPVPDVPLPVLSLSDQTWTFASGSWH